MMYERVNQPKVEPYKLLANETCHWFWILLPSKVSPSGRPAGGNNKKKKILRHYVPPPLPKEAFIKPSSDTSCHPLPLERVLIFTSHNINYE